MIEKAILNEVYNYFLETAEPHTHKDIAHVFGYDEGYAKTICEVLAEKGFINFANESKGEYTYVL